jgi:arylformamidase
MAISFVADNDPVFEYLTGQRRDTHDALLAEFEKKSAECVARLSPALDIRYGSGARQTFDVFRSRGECRGTVLFFHAGYWQSRDKAGFRFLAEPFVANNINFIFVNYPRCPEVTLHTLVEAAAQSVPAILGHLGAAHPRQTGLIVAGHSAGGHIAVELALMQWPDHLKGGRPIERVISLSGVFDLQPLLRTPLNNNLRLSPDEAYRASPLFRASGVNIPALFIVGGTETPAFQKQSEAMCVAWRDAGNPSDFIVVPEADHFSLLTCVGDPQHPVFKHILSR